MMNLNDIYLFYVVFGCLFVIPIVISKNVSYFYVYTWYYIFLVL